MSKNQKGVFEGKLCRPMNSAQDYELGTRKARFFKDSGFVQKRFLAGFCSDSFESITGIKLSLGEEVLVKITIETTQIKKVRK